MGIRDDELKRLKKYAEGLGIKVYFKSHVKGCGGAEWDIDDQSIYIYESPRLSKTDLILAFIHELGHHLDWIYKNKKTNKQVENAYEKLGKGPMYGYRLDLTQKERNIIYQAELDGIQYMEDIYKELNLKIPYWKVKMTQHTDAYEYKLLAKEGRFTTIKEGRKYRMSITKEFKEKYGDTI